MEAIETPRYRTTLALMGELDEHFFIQLRNMWSYIMRVFNHCPEGAKPLARVVLHTSLVPTNVDRYIASMQGQRPPISTILEIRWAYHHARYCIESYPPDEWARRIARQRAQRKAQQ